MRLEWYISPYVESRNDSAGEVLVHPGVSGVSVPKEGQWPNLVAQLREGLRDHPELHPVLAALLARGLVELRLVGEGTCHAVLEPLRAGIDWDRRGSAAGRPLHALSSIRFEGPHAIFSVPGAAAQLRLQGAAALTALGEVAQRGGLPQTGREAFNAALVDHLAPLIAMCDGFAPADAACEWEAADFEFHWHSRRADVHRAYGPRGLGDPTIFAPFISPRADWSRTLPLPRALAGILPGPIARSVRKCSRPCSIQAASRCCRSSSAAAAAPTCVSREYPASDLGRIPPLHPRRWGNRRAADGCRRAAARRTGGLVASVLWYVEHGKVFECTHHALSRLPEADPSAAAALMRAYAALADKDDRDALVEVAAGLIDRFGGPCWDGLSSRMPGFAPRSLQSRA